MPDDSQVIAVSSEAVGGTFTVSSRKGGKLVTSKVMKFDAPKAEVDAEIARIARTAVSKQGDQGGR